MLPLETSTMLLILLPLMRNLICQAKVTNTIERWEVASMTWSQNGQISNTCVCVCVCFNNNNDFGLVGVMGTNCEHFMSIEITIMFIMFMQ